MRAMTRSFATALAVLAVVLQGGCSQPEPPAVEEEVVEEVVVTTETVCDDGVDEDRDGATDCSDSDCAASELCAIAQCKKVCAEIFECGDIIDACTEKELVGVLKGCQDSCSDESVRSQVSMADGVPCFVIGGVFLEQVQGQGICLGEDDPGAGGGDAAKAADT